MTGIADAPVPGRTMARSGSDGQLKALTPPAERRREVHKPNPSNTGWEHSAQYYPACQTKQNLPEANPGIADGKAMPGLPVVTNIDAAKLAVRRATMTPGVAERWGGGARDG